MENASKALIMAGGVLIALMVIGVLVLFFNNLSNLQNIKQTSEEVEKITEFNKQYDVYARNVYGSELLSIANKIEDYNKRESNNKGYAKIELEVKITDKNNPNETIFNKEKNAIYTAEDLTNIRENIKEVLAEYSNSKNTDMVYGNGKYKRTIAQLATMRTKEIADLLEIEENGQTMKEIQVKISQYYIYKNLESDIKQRIFTYKKFDYDGNTGRITKMCYEL